MRRFLILAFLLSNLAWAAAPIKTMSPFGYNVQVVVADYSCEIGLMVDPQTGTQIPKPPIRMHLTVTDLMGGPPSSDVRFDIMFLDNPHDIISDAMYRAFGQDTNRAFLCSLHNYSASAPAGHAMTPVEVHPEVDPGNPLGPNTCVIPEGDYRFVVIAHDASGKSGYTGGLLHIPIQPFRSCGGILMF